MMMMKMRTAYCPLTCLSPHLLSPKHLARLSLLKSWSSPVSSLKSRQFFWWPLQSLQNTTELKPFELTSLCPAWLVGNLPDPGKAQDFVKKLAQVLDDDERIRDQLETLVSPSCSCKQAEVCVVSLDVSGCQTLDLVEVQNPSGPSLRLLLLQLI